MNMSLMNYHLYANGAKLPQIMAEDAGAADLRNPVFYIRTEYKIGKIRRFFEKIRRQWNEFWNAPLQEQAFRRHPGLSF